MTCRGTGMVCRRYPRSIALAGRYIAEAVNPEPTFSDERKTGPSREGSLQEKRRKPVVAEVKARQTAKGEDSGSAFPNHNPVRLSPTYSKVLFIPRAVFGNQDSNKSVTAVRFGAAQ
jgi:hypothetical protein